jgi:L-ascorbate metabolism protein UlaG (beta-lactamase superfamily)
VLPVPGTAEVVGRVPFRVLRIRHNPTPRRPDQHVGFLLGATTIVLHVGDADPAADNFAVFRQLPAVDLAFLPYWYLLDPAGRRLVTGSIRPRRVVAMHVPPRDVAEVEAALRTAQVDAVVAAVPGSPIVLRGPQPRP